MGWRADKAYEDAQREGFRKWKPSLTWPEYLAWQWGRHRHFLTGAAMALAWGGIFWWMLGLN